MNWYSTLHFHENWIPDLCGPHWGHKDPRCFVLFDFLMNAGNTVKGRNTVKFFSRPRESKSINRKSTRIWP